MKKIKPLIIIMIFLLPVVLPFVKVDSVIDHTVTMTTPYDGELFSYSDTSETLVGYSITSGLIIDTEYEYYYQWLIDSVHVDTGSGSKMSSHGGVLIISDECDTVFDPSEYTVGDHDAKLTIKIFYDLVEQTAGDKTHEWSRDNSPPESIPSVSFTTPGSPYTSYNYSFSGINYACAWTISDQEDDIADMELYLDGVLQKDFGAVVKGDYDWIITIDSEKMYTILVNGTDDDSNDYSETTYLVAYYLGSYIDAGVDNRYHNSEIAFSNFESGDTVGLNNCSYSVEDYSFWTKNTTETTDGIEMSDTYNYTFSNKWSQFVDDYEVVYSVPDNWYSTSWGFRKKLTFTSDTVLTAHQIDFEIIVADSIYDDDKANGDDWVITTSDGETPVNHWIEDYDDSGTTTVWIKGSLISGDTVFYIYYGNSGASNSEDPLNVFISWDDFDAGYSAGDSPLVARNWTNSNGTPTIETAPFGASNKALRLEDSAANYDETRSNWGENITVVIHTTFYVETQAGDVSYFSTYEGTETITTGRVRGSSDDIAFYEGTYKDFVPNLGWTEDTIHDLNMYIRDNDFDIVFDGVDHEGDLRTAYSSGVEEIRLTANWVDGNAVQWWDDFFVCKYSSAVISLAKGSELEGYDSGSHTITEEDNKGIINGGSTFTLDFNSSVNIYVNITIILMIHETVFSVYNSSEETVQTNSFTFNSSAWSSLSDGWFNMNVSMFDDVMGYYSQNLTYYKDTGTPVVTLRSPENRTALDPYSNLQIIPLDYKIEDDVVEDGAWMNDMKTLIIDGESFTGDDWVQYPKYKPLQFWEGLHNLTIRAKDWAGNVGEATVGFYYEARLEKPLELTFTSSIDDETIDPEQYLNIYINGMPISATTSTNLNDFTITVYNKFGILLNSTLFEYSATIDIELPLRPVTFENENEVVCEYKISYGLFEKSFWILAGAEQTYYLNDTNYILVAESGEEMYNETHWYVTTYIPFTVESGMSDIGVTLNIMSDNPLYHPLMITLYNKELDVDSGYVYIYYETSWGNTTILVKDNDVPLGSAKSEGWSIWLFDTEDYCLHNITIIIKNGETIVFTDGFSFTIVEPEANPNYYLTIHTSIDVSGGVLYVTVNTDWGNCTIRVFDNDVPLGGNTSEGSSVWYFDEEVFGLHNFTIEVYQGNDLWDIIVTSVTIMAPDAETLSLTLYSVQFDIDSSYIYINYATTWGNTTVQVFDNSSSLGDAVSGEELSIWTTTTDYGWHNITVIIYDDEVEWFTDVFSFTIVAPDTETNYFEALSISIDANAGQLYTSIHTYFGNCTVGVKDNSTWLGDNTTEGDIIWTFDTDYGFHNFSVYVFQNEEIWHIIYTSVTIVEPIPEESMLFTLFEKSVDADSGLFYLNYETNWGNTTCQVFDNTTELGDSDASEGLSIWLFTTDYGFHNITVEIYCGVDLVYVDVISFVIQEPDTEINYYLIIDTSIDASSGLLYVTIETFWNNCTIRVKDNETWLGSAVDEGSSVWQFDEDLYGLHSFSIYVYQGAEVWTIVYTSITIIEPIIESNYLTMLSISVDASSGLFYITVTTYWGNQTVRVKDNETWLGIAQSEGNSIWSFDETAYGLHNFSIVIYNGGDIWETIYTSVTIVEPDIETNYFLVVSTSVDVSSGLLYITIETYFGNCTIRARDNSTWLGANITEGSSIWSFTTSYGFHNFSIFIYQSNDLWNTIYTSITIVEPDVEVLALTLYDKIIDADAGLIYINYETNWGNTTIRVMDNGTWIGSAVAGEENSIWSFTTDYGLHNITVLIYNDGVPWFTDIFSFTIIVPYQIWKELTFIFTSSYDSAIIPAYDYLDVYLNEDTKFIGTGNGMGVVLYDIFNISVYDRFGQLLYEEVDRLYEETISINLPMRLANFINPNSVVCYYRLALGIHEQSFWITQTQTIGYYMFDGNYTIIAEPTTLDAGGGYEYVPTTDSFEVVAGMSDIGVTLLTQQITIIYRPITIRATSQYTGASISEHYLQYYLNGILSMEGASTETANLTIQLCVTDVFGNVLYNQSVAYSRYLDVTVPLRSCTFTNKELVSTTLTITQSGSEEHLFFVLGGAATISVYLADGTYTVIHAPISPDKEEGVLWQPKDYDFTCSLSSQSLDMWLDTFDNVPPLFDPFGGNILDWLTNNRWMTLAGIGIGALNLIGLVFAVGVIITRLPKREEKGFDSK